MSQLFNIFGRINIDGLNSARSQLTSLNSTGSKVGTTLKNVGSSITGVGTKMTVGLTVPIVGLITKSAMLASDLNESMNVVNETFGKSAKNVANWAGSLNKDYGMVKLEAMNYVGSMGAMLKSSGLSSKASEDMSKSLVELTGDMSSFYNLGHDETWEKIRSGISGETEPLKSLGINMSVANLEAYALSQGINKSWKEMTQAEQVSLRYGYLMETTSTAQGDFSRTSGGFSNQLKILQGNLTNVGVSIGEIVLPYFNKGVKIVNSLTKRFENLSPGIKKIIVVVGLAVAIIGPLLLGLGGLIGVVGFAISGFTALAGIITAVSAPMVAIGAVIGIVVGIFATLAIGIGYVLIKTGALQEIWKNVKGLFNAAKPVITSLAIEGFHKLKEAISFVKHILDQVSKVAKPFIFSTIKEAKPIIKGIIKNFKEFGMALLDNIGKKIKSMKKTWDSVWPKLKPIVVAIFKIIKTSIISSLKVIKGALKLATAVMKGDWSKAWKAIKNIVKVLLTATKNVIKAIFKAKSTIIRNIMNGIKSKISSIWKSIKSKVSSIVNGIKNAISKKLKSAASTVGKLATTFKKKGLSIGKSIVKGIINGIKNMAGDVKRAASNMASAAISSAKSALKVFSPSKVFMEIGEYTTKGLSIGLEKDKANIGKILKSMLELESTITKTDIGKSALLTSQSGTLSTSQLGTLSMNENKKEINMNLSGTIKVDTGREVFNLSKDIIEDVIRKTLIDNVNRYVY